MNSTASLEDLIPAHAKDMVLNSVASISPFSAFSLYLATMFSIAFFWGAVGSYFCSVLEVVDAPLGLAAGADAVLLALSGATTVDDGAPLGP